MNNDKKVTNVLVVGVGGQGVIVASKILTNVALNAGFDVKKSEVHGMAQRGGSVVSQVRFGAQVFSPLVKKGEGDILLSFEQLESLRYLDFLYKDSFLLLNSQKILPPSVSMGLESYPADIPEKIKKQFKNTVLVEGLDLAVQAGNAKAINTVLLGVLSQKLDIKEAIWLKAIREYFPSTLHAVNERGFALGRDLNISGNQ